MASLIANYVSSRFLKETWDNKFGQEDTLFERIPATQLNTVPLKDKTRQKALLAGISKHDKKILTKVKRRAYYLDMSLFSCCGVRFGWGSVIGVIPCIGDVLEVMMAIMVIGTCQQVERELPAEVKKRMYIRMYANVILCFIIGLVPVFGDLFAAAFQANTQNAIILESYLCDSAAKTVRERGDIILASDPSDPDEYDWQLRGNRLHV